MVQKIHPRGTPGAPPGCNLGPKFPPHVGRSAEKNWQQFRSYIKKSMTNLKFSTQPQVFDLTLFQLGRDNFYHQQYIPWQSLFGIVLIKPRRKEYLLSRQIILSDPVFSIW